MSYIEQWIQHYRNHWYNVAPVLIQAPNIVNLFCCEVEVKHLKPEAEPLLHI